MNKRLMTCFICFLFPLIAHGNDMDSDTNNAVISYLKAKEESNKCSQFMAFASSDPSKKPTAFAVCDNDFVTSKGITFSDVQNFSSPDGDVVCGIVSGSTQISKIGGRFVYQKKNGQITFMPSKQPMMDSAAAGTFGKNQIKLENQQYHNIHSMLCK